MEYQNPKRHASVQMIPNPIRNLHSPQHLSPTETKPDFAPATTPPRDDHHNKKRKKDFDFSYFESFPPGYRFCPNDYELITFYLKPKISNHLLPANKIIEDNIYLHNPETLADEYKKFWDTEWYFFTPRDKKYPNGNRPSRAAGDGYWKATGSDKPILDKKNNNAVVGYKKALVFYQGKPPKGQKTDWIMHEYRVHEPNAPAIRSPTRNMKLDKCVLCKIKKKQEKGNHKSSFLKKAEAKEEPNENEIDTGINDSPKSYDSLNPYSIFNPPVQTGFSEIFHSDTMVPFSNYTSYVDTPDFNSTIAEQESLYHSSNIVGFVHKDVASNFFMT